MPEPQDHIQTILSPQLNPGDSIGIIAPASPFDKTKLFDGISVLKRIGVSCVFSEELFESQGYLAGSDAHRAKLLHEMFLNESVKAVWCARGGYGSLRILSMINYDVIRSHPKLFIGSSDITTLLNTFYFKCGFVTFHGPMIESLGNADQLTIESLKAVLFSPQKIEISPPKGAVIKSGISRGNVSGGNLSTLCHLAGTPFAPNLSGHLLFIEDIGEAPYRIDRMLTQMRIAGMFDGIIGIILGSFVNCGKTEDIYKIVDDVFRDTNFPILGGFDVGHGKPNFIIPFGVEAILNTDDQVLSYTHRVFKK